MDNKLRDDINWKNIVILMTYVVKAGHKLYPKICLEEAL